MSFTAFAYLLLNLSLPSRFLPTMLVCGSRGPLASAISFIFRKVFTRSWYMAVVVVPAENFLAIVFALLHETDCSKADLSSRFSGSGTSGCFNFSKSLSGLRLMTLFGLIPAAIRASFSSFNHSFALRSASFLARRSSFFL